MKAISLWEPWGTLIAVGEKTYETRSWNTKHRGDIAIHCAKRWKEDQQLTAQQPPFSTVLRFAGYDLAELDTKLPLGCVIAIANLTAVYDAAKLADRMQAVTGHDYELAFGNYAAGRYAWELKNIRRLAKPIPVIGAQGIWDWTPPAGYVLPD